MNSQPSIPDPGTRKRHAENMREACQQLEAVTLALDELIAMVEADIRRQPRNIHLLNKYKHLMVTANQNQPS